MDSSMQRKFIKARQYAQEPERIRLESLSVEMAGDDRTHSVHFQEGEWRCDCEYAKYHEACAHTMAMERVLGTLLKPALATA